MIGFVFLEALLVILCIAGLGFSFYILYSVIKDRPLVHPSPSGFMSTYLGRGKTLKVKLVIVGVGMSIGWLFLLFGILLT